MKCITLKVNIVILCFAVAHAVASFLFMHVFSIADDFVLTTLTIFMILTIIKMCDGVVLQVFLPLALCIVGYFIGTKGAEMLESALPFLSEYINSIMAFITTVILGWLTFLLVRRGVKNSVKS